MKMKEKLSAVMAAASIALALVPASARADEIPLITGAQWMQSSDQAKKAYLVGIANIVQIETAYESGNPPPDSQSILPRLAKGLRGQTLDSVRLGLDRWYTANSDRLQRPVIETLWFEMVLPGLKYNK